MKKVILFVMAAVLSVAINAQTVFTEDFSGTTFTNGIGPVPANWTVYTDNLVNSDNYDGFSQGWDIYNFSDIGPMAVSVSWTEPQGNPCDRWLISPAIGINQPGLYLKFTAVGYDDSFPEVLNVKISTTGVEKTDFTTTALSLPAVPVGMNEYLVDLSAYENDSIHVAFVNNGDGYYLILGQISVLVPPQNEIVLNKVDVPAYAQQNTNFNVKGTVTNKGTAALTSFNVTYNIDGGTDVATYTVSGINVPYNGTYEFTHNVPASIANVGTSTINVTVSKPNTEDDEISNNSGSASVMVYDNGVQRTVLLEQFTTANCGYCPQAHDYLKPLVEARAANVIWMTHHAGFYTDDLTIPENQEMLAFYNDGGSTYAPAAMLDRTYFPESGEPGPVMSAYIEAAMFDAEISKPSFISVDITNVSFNSQTRQLEVTVSGTVASNVMAGFNSPRVSLYLKEDNLKINTAQSGSNLGRNYIHNNAMRASISDVWGDANVITNTTAGSTYSKTYTYTVPATIKATDLSLVAFVTEYNTDVNSRSVLNAKAVKLTDVASFDPTGIADVENVEMSMYPNPANDYVMISSSSVIKEVAVINALGQKVATYTTNAENVRLDTQDLAKGVYMISILTNEGSAVKKLTVVK